MCLLTLINFILGWHVPIESTYSTLATYSTTASPALMYLVVIANKHKHHKQTSASDSFNASQE